MPEKLAVLCSDLHLSHAPPVARSGEPDWYEAMARPLRELKHLADGIPVICGGDVFDRWNSPPSLINFAFTHLPLYFYSVMGQHDLPYHSWEERGKSAFMTLCLGGGRFFLLRPVASWIFKEKLLCHGYSWGQEFADPAPASVATGGEKISMAVSHQFVWRQDTDSWVSEVSTDRNEVIRVVSENLPGYRVVLFGDNHKGFLESRSKCTVFNAGTFMRRRSDEKDYAPMVGVLREDGSVVPHRLDTSRDVLEATEKSREAEQVLVHLDSFLEELTKLGESGLDFRRAVERTMIREQVSGEVRRVILEAMEKVEDGKR